MSISGVHGEDGVQSATAMATQSNGACGENAGATTAGDGGLQEERISALPFEDRHQLRRTQRCAKERSGVLATMPAE